MPDPEHRLEEIRQELEELDRRRQELLRERRALELADRPSPRPPDLTPATEEVQPPETSAPVHHRSSPAAKVALFRSLFRGREDVYPRRWQSATSGRSGYAFACANEWRPGVCEKPRIRCRDCGHRDYLPLTDETVAWHLKGRRPGERPRPDGTFPDFTLGVYPLLPDETTWFLAADFDKRTWASDAGAFLATCQAYDVPAALERSRSGNGGHVWIFFLEPIPASLARRLGTQLLAAALDARPEIGMESYDRFFPSQDTMPKGGFGNLIALPLQKTPRASGNSVFVDEELRPFPDQWAYLSTRRRLSLEEVEERCRQTARNLDPSLAMEADDAQATLPWETPRATSPPAKIPPEDLPDHIRVVSSNRLYIPKDGLPPSLRHRLLRLATFGNPEFFQAQRLRFSTHDKPRFLCRAEDLGEFLALPRGCLEDLEELLRGLEIALEVDDQRVTGEPLELRFQGTLRPAQRQIATQLLEHETGVLAAPTGFGKTVLGAHLIAQRGVSTLVLVHRRELLEQWHAQLTSLLGLDANQVGRLGGGRRKPTGVIDVATIQSLVRKGVVDESVTGYGHLVVDECHHISAVSFEAVAQASRARFVTGLSATVRRKDGHHPIVFMQCGPLRHEVSAKALAAERPFDHKVRVRQTRFQLPEDRPEEPPKIQDVYRALVADPDRNALILDDVIASVDEGRCPVLLTERKEHLAYFEKHLEGFVQNLIVLHGGLRPKARRTALTRLQELPETAERLLLATGRYLGEGFDDPRLDTLFLVFPVSWQGTLKQYAGRLHRLHAGKTEVRVYDYLDAEVPLLARMFEKRRRGYRALGYTLEDHPKASEQ